MKRLVVISFLLLSAKLSAQLPNTQLYTITFEMGTDSMSISQVQYLSDFNPKGYNNQPSFFNENELWITSNYKNANKTDIFKLNTKREEISQITATSSSEYSPTLMPNKKEFSVIRALEIDGETVQWLWAYPINQESCGKAIIEDIKNVGYHQWISDHEIALFLVGDPHQLVIHDLDDGSNTPISKNIGRSIIKRGENIYFVYKLSNKFWHLKSYNLITKKTDLVIKTLPDQEDFTMSREGYFIMGKGSELYMFDPAHDKNWKRVADLSQYGLQKISRLAISGNQLAVVDVK